MIDDIEAHLTEAQRSLSALRSATIDRDSMIEALVRMLGPKGLAVWKLWSEQGTDRIDVTWAGMSGEELAQKFIDLHESPESGGEYERESVGANWPNS